MEKQFHNRQFGTILSLNKTRDVRGTRRGQDGCFAPIFFCSGKESEMKEKKFTVRQLAACALVAALYAAVTIASGPLAYGLVQFRLSEALMVLCWFEPVLAVGVTLGCFLANLFSTVTALDMVIGTLATAIACIATIRVKNPWLVPLPNILSNAVLVGGMLAYVMFPDHLLTGFAIAAAQVGFGELVVMYVLGMPLLFALRRAGFPKMLRHSAHTAQ